MACYRRRSTVWPGKLISSKKTPKNSVFWRQEIGITSLWEDLEAKLLTPGQLLGYPWKVWGITVQTSYLEGRWHQNWVRSRPTILVKSSYIVKSTFLLCCFTLTSETKHPHETKHHSPLCKSGATMILYKNKFEIDNNLFINLFILSRRLAWLFATPNCSFE